MKVGLKCLFFLALSLVGITSASAAAFKIGDAEYDSLVDAVNAVPTDDQLTTIEMTQDVKNQAGVQIDAHKNIVIDFHGHRYEASGPFVGADAKHQTISFRLMKDAKVYLKNGTLVASTESDSKMFIQNYADLKLEDITIDAAKNEYDYFYAVSSNNGKVDIVGNTSIYVNESKHARAFDMCWAPKVSNGIYAGGTQITVETYGTITGYIELDVWGTFDDANGIKSTLELKNLDFHGKWIVDPLLKNQLVIDGGKYLNPGYSEDNRPPEIPTHKDPYIDIRKYLKDGNASFNLDNHFYVLPSKMVAYDNDKLFIVKDNVYDFTSKIPAGYEKYVQYKIEDESIVSIKDGILKGLKDGVTKVTVILGETKSGQVKKEFDAIVFDLSTATDYEANKNEGKAVTNVIADILEKVLDGDTTEGIDVATKNKVIDAIQNGKTVTAEVAVKEVKEEDVDPTVVKKIKDSVKQGELVSFLNIDLLLKADGSELGKITKLGDTVQVSVDVDKSLGEVPANKKRTFFVVRTHEGEEPEIIKAELINGKLVFETDRFSDYAYGYSDEDAEKNPNTVDNSITYIALLTIALIGLIAIKKRINE